MITKIILTIKVYTGLSFRKVIEYSRSNIHWNTIYKFFIKLQKYNVISLSYNQTVKRYIKKNVNKDSNIFLLYLDKSNNYFNCQTYLILIT